MIRAERSAAQARLAEREELTKLRLEIDVERLEIRTMEQEAEECIKARATETCLRPWKAPRFLRH